jgi:hypothetical protein
MKLVYTGIVSALLATGAFAQAPQLTGSGEFCLSVAGKADCRFADAASCHKERDALMNTPTADVNAGCIIRREVE